MKTSFDRPVLGSEADVSTKSREKRFLITLVRLGDTDEVSREMITAPGAAAAAVKARQIFPGADILSVALVPDPLPVRAARDKPHAPSARFIRGMFRPALFSDEKTLHKLLD
ncbi:hypothetical protein [Magnetovibrio blakemorei]|uniref:Uncharacterized protein n=1 Tax=Magnetovibrio blakemorei TaxID=28181 RepID=A0A1E5Q673_9PROT|nr:hypothetical protein [Magnetovibrio blakemorei]OEJ65559.1 hypothetical protein BEN30_13965 [Magnetovibrio blakemorei]